MDYVVGPTDSLERIAALHDCTVGELMKLNRMHSRMVFPGQKLLVPLPISDDVFEGEQNSSKATKSGNAADGIRKGPGGAVPEQLRKYAGVSGSVSVEAGGHSDSLQRSSLAKTLSMPIPSSGSTDEADQDCLQRFLKIKVKQLTESDGVVTGTLLVTPNCLMFDPDVSHPLVKENGQDLYGMVANMNEIVAVSVYTDVGGLIGDRQEKKREIFDPAHIRTPPEAKEEVVLSQGTDHPEANAEFFIPASQDTCSQAVDREVVFTTCGSDVDDEEVAGGAGSRPLGSESQLPSISEMDSPGDDERRRAVSDVTYESSLEDVRRRHSRSPNSQSSEERPRSFSELDAPQGPGFGSRFSPNAARRSFGKLGRTLSARAKSIQGSVTQGAERVAQGTKTVAHEVVTHTKSAADSLHTGLETGVKAVGGAANAAATQAKAAADVVVNVPGKVVDMSVNMVSDGLNGVQDMFNVDVEERPTVSMKREQSLATLQGLRERTEKARELAAKNMNQNIFHCATSSDEMPDLFIPVEDMVNANKGDQMGSGNGTPQLPYFMAVRLTRKKKVARRVSPSGHSSVSSYDEDCPFGNKLKREFWYTIPRSRADNIYHFLLQWNPEKYGKDTTVTSEEDGKPSEGPAEDRSFIVLDSTADDRLASDYLMGAEVSHEAGSRRPRAATVAPYGLKNKKQDIRKSRSSTESYGTYPMGRARQDSCPEQVLTSYDVKQLMMWQQNTANSNVSKSRAMTLQEQEDNVLSSMHEQFGGKSYSPGRSSSEDDNPVLSFDVNGRTTSDASARRSSSSLSSDSRDSGLGRQSTSMEKLNTIDFSREEMHLPQSLLRKTLSSSFDENDTLTPIAETPLTPTSAATAFDDAAKKNQKRRFVARKLFKRKTPKNVEAETRSRSKSLGANDVLQSEKPGTSVLGSSVLNREWELVTVSEMYRRLSLDNLLIGEMPIPTGAEQSQILDEIMIRQVMDILPARAEGYPWGQIYSSEKHGFSLATLYRKMVEWDEDLSPVLLIIRDTRERVFGAVVSGSIRPADHYTGTGDSCLLWRFTGTAPHTRELRHYKWTGENQFFVNAAKDSLHIGAGGGHYGLWLDADLNYGRSQRCETFDNEPLTGEKEDFIVQFVEAFGFRE